MTTKRNAKISAISSFEASRMRELEREFTKIQAKSFYAIGTSNSLAGLAIADAIEALIKAGLYKRGAKYAAKRANEIQNKYLRYESRTLTNIKQFQFYNDLIDLYWEYMQPHIQRLKNNTERILKLNKKKYAECLAQVFTTGSIIEFAVLRFDDYFNYFPLSNGMNIAKYFQEMRLGGCLSAWDEVLRNLQQVYGEWLDFGNKERYKLLEKAKKNFLLKAADVDALNDCILKAQKMNPNVEFSQE